MAKPVLMSRATGSTPGRRSVSRDMRPVVHAAYTKASRLALHQETAAPIRTCFTKDMAPQHC